MSGDAATDALCHRCKTTPYVTTVSEGAREIALCLNCVQVVSYRALRWSNGHPRKPAREAWTRELKEV